MSHREVLKNIIQFGKREYKEKKPLKLKILRMKSKSVLTRGLLPSLNVRQVGLVHYLITAEYTDYIRVYSFSKHGQLLGGENLERNPAHLNELSKKTKKVYHLPKEKPKLGIEDITSFYRNEFNKILERFNSSYGLSIKFPLIIKADKEIGLSACRQFGSKKEKTLFKITLKAYKSNLFNLIVYREIFYVYLNNVMELKNKRNISRCYYDLALLCSHYYFKGKKAQLFYKLLNKEKDCNLSAFGLKFNLTQSVMDLLSQETPVRNNEDRDLLLSNLINTLNILNHFGIKLSVIEFISLLIQLDNYFRGNLFASPKTNKQYYLFHQKCYKDLHNHLKQYLRKNTHLDKEKEIYEISHKINFLFIIFTFLSNLQIPPQLLGVEEDNVEELFNYVKELKNKERVQKDILQLDQLIDQALSELIFSQILTFKYQIFQKEKHLFLNMKLINSTDYTFQMVNFSIKWKPKNRLSQLQEELEEDEDKAQKSFSEKLKREYHFLINNLGTVTLYVVVQCQNPQNPKQTLAKKQKLKKMILNNH